MSKESDIEMKQGVLNMLKDLMMGEQGKRLKPKSIEVEMISTKPVGKLDDVLEEASKEETEGEEEMLEDEEESTDKKKSLRDYFSRK